MIKTAQHFFIILDIRMAKVLIWLLMTTYVLSGDDFGKMRPLSKMLDETLPNISASVQEKASDQHEPLIADPRDQLELDYDTAVKLVTLPLRCINVEYPTLVGKHVKSEIELLDLCIPPIGKKLFTYKR